LNACEYIGKFALLMRTSLTFSREQFSSILEEVKFLEAYLELEKLRFDSKFFYHIDYKDEINDINIPSLMVQPLIENAIKHAFLGKNNGGYINIKYTRIERDRIQVSVSDNGIWLANKHPFQNKQATSLGLKIIQDRLQLMKNDLKDEKIGMQIYPSSHSGTKIILVLPIIFPNRNTGQMNDLTSQ
ncbi:MAG: histidine kinase, partial [Flavobacteriales bacterium]|nr:histidine kinase [Flavobacteriales bacterium]